jgi:hypothetical protein
MPRTESAEWVFLCECGSPTCEERIELSLCAFESRAGSDSVLAPGHLLVCARAARGEARRLREEAAALRAQAEQISRRYAVDRRLARGAAAPAQSMITGSQSVA